MPCYHPLQAYRTPEGAILFSDKPRLSWAPLKLPCSGCVGCRVARRNSLAIRCVHETETTVYEKGSELEGAPRASFCTFTYNDQNLAKDLSLSLRDWQLFAKKLRKTYGPFRYLVAGEYGDTYLRPHMHAVILGQNFLDDRELIRETSRGNLYTSKRLASVWGKGFVSFGAVEYDSAAYVAGYTMKKVNGEMAKERYQRVDEQTGEVWHVAPEFGSMSRGRRKDNQGGLGYRWFQKHWKDIYPRDSILMNGKELRPPRYYDRLLEEKDPELFAAVKEKRKEAMDPFDPEHSPERLALKERVFKSRMKAYMQERIDPGA